MPADDDARDFIQFPSTAHIAVGPPVGRIVRWSECSDPNSWDPSLSHGVDPALVTPHFIGTYRNRVTTPLSRDVLEQAIQVLRAAREARNVLRNSFQPDTLGESPAFFQLWQAVERVYAESVDGGACRPSTDVLPPADTGRDDAIPLPPDTWHPEVDESRWAEYNRKFLALLGEP